jgi:hypothetical protein
MEGAFKMLRYLPYLLVLALVIYALIDCLGTPEAEIRALPKPIWLLIIMFFPLAWLLVGKRRNAPAVINAPAETWIPPDDNPEFLKSLGEAEARRREQDPGSTDTP